MNEQDNASTQQDVVLFQRRFGVIERTIYYENINGETEIHMLRMSVDNTNSLKRSIVYVYTADLYGMIFGKERGILVYSSKSNLFKSFVELNQCINGELFSESFLESIPHGRELYEHFLDIVSDGGLRFDSSIIHITTSYMDDFFLNPNPDLEYLRRIISNKDPACYVIWERLVLQKYKKYMPNVVTRMINYSVLNSATPLLTLRVIFATMVSEEPAVRRIVKCQLLNRKEEKTYSFFINHFIPFIKTSIDILVNFPYYHDNIYLVFAYVIGRIQTAWRSKSLHICKVTIDDRRKTLEDLATNARIKKATKKSKTQAKRGKRVNQKKVRIGRRGRQ